MLRKEAKTLEQAQGLGGRLASTKLYIICLVSNTTIILYRRIYLSSSRMFHSLTAVCLTVLIKKTITTKRKGLFI